MVFIYGIMQKMVFIFGIYALNDMFLDVLAWKSYEEIDFYSSLFYAVCYEFHV
jgi:hypothetical protein